MKIYQTNAGLGHDEYAFLIRLEKSTNGYNYLCIGTQSDDESYSIGEVVKNLEDIYVTESAFKIEESPIYNKHLFEALLKEKNPFNDIHGNNVTAGSTIRILEYSDRSLIGSLATVHWNEEEGMLTFKLVGWKIQHIFKRVIFELIK